MDAVAPSSTSRGAQGSSTLIHRRTPLSFSFASLLKVSSVKERAKLGIQSGQSVGFGGIDRKMCGKQCAFVQSGAHAATLLAI